MGKGKVDMKMQEWKWMREWISKFQVKKKKKKELATKLLPVPYISNLGRNRVLVLS
jgi:hypothetical protein